jgi:uncharacterized beta-barrel protein YwiB (DUF1934 family)
VNAQSIPIQVKFVTEIHDGPRKETIAFETIGLYYDKGQTTYVTFQEPNDQGEVKTMLKIKQDEVVITRAGAVVMRQIHKKGQLTTGTYESQLGSFSLQTKTDNVHFEWSEKNRKGQLFLTYALQIQENNAGRYAITITFKEEIK